MLRNYVGLVISSFPTTSAQRSGKPTASVSCHHEGYLSYKTWLGRMSAEKKQITRNRASLSCQTCRRRKVKCDKIHPICSSCHRAGEDCIYGDAPKSDATTAVHRIAEENGESRKRRAVAVEGNDETQGHKSSLAIAVIEQKLSQLNNLLHDFSRLTPVSNGNSPTSHQLSENPRHTAGDAVLRLSQLGIGDDAFNNRHNGLPSSASEQDHSWSQVIGKLDQLNDLLKSNIRPPITKHVQQVKSSVENGPDFRDQAQTKFRHDVPHIEGIMRAPPASSLDFGYPDMLAPSPDESNVLFRSWLWSIHAMFPIVSPQLVLRKYQTFYEWYRNDMDNGRPNPDPSFMPFLSLIWYTGYGNLSKRAHDRWFPWVTTMYRSKMREKLVRDLAVMKTETTPSIWILATSVVCQYLALEGQDIPTNSMRNMLNLRAAQGLSIHSERSLKSLSEAEAEMRRRLMWETLSLDASLSAVSGMPVVLDECYTDTKTISELKTSCLGTKEAADYEEHVQDPDMQPDRPDDPTSCYSSSLVSVYHLVAKARHELTSATKKVLKANMRARPMTMDELKEVRKALAKTSKEVNKIITRIPIRGVPEMDFAPQTHGSVVDLDHLNSMAETVTDQEINWFLRETHDHCDIGGLSKHHKAATTAFHKWARITLSMMIDRLDCISYAPFLKNSKSRLWAVARGCALRACQSFMRKFVSLAEDPELRRYRWAWSTIAHPIHATIIMLVDLHDRPHSDEAPRSRAMIDKMFALADSGHDDPEVSRWPGTAVPLREGGEEAWIMLRKLRQKAWLKAGLDPDVLWTEDDQMSVGVGKPLNENDLFVRSLREDIIHGHRQMKQRAEGGTKPTTYDNFVRCAGTQEIVKQVLHPSQIGPGEQVSGPITRGVVDVDMWEPTKVLLLRARRDQELMPFPLQARQAPSDKIAQPLEDPLQTYRQELRQNNEVGILHIGELIKKIRQTQASKSPLQLQPDTVLPTERPTWPDSPAENAHAFGNNCNFREQNGVMNVALQELQDKHLAPTASNESESIEPSDLSNDGSENPERATAQPTRSFISYFYNDPSTASRPNVLRQQSLETRESLATAASIPPTLHNHGYTRNRPQVSIFSAYAQAERPASNMQASYSSPPDPIHKMDNINHDMAGPSINNSDVADEEFDWERWDEMFGQFAGFEEMLMDISHEGLETAHNDIAEAYL